MDKPLAVAKHGFNSPKISGLHKRFSSGAKSSGSPSGSVWWRVEGVAENGRRPGRMKKGAKALGQDRRAKIGTERHGRSTVRPAPEVGREKRAGRDGCKATSKSPAIGKRPKAADSHGQIRGSLRRDHGNHDGTCQILIVLSATFNRARTTVDYSKGLAVT